MNESEQNSLQSVEKPYIILRTTMWYCLKCEREIRPCNFNRHWNSCKNGIKPKYVSPPLGKAYHCKFCNRKFVNKESNLKAKNGRNGHQGSCKLNPNYELTCERKRQAKLGTKLSKQKKNKISMSMKKYWDLLHKRGKDSRELFHKINSDEDIDIFFDEDF
jgi:hypothetical protein